MRFSTATVRRIISCALVCASSAAAGCYSLHGQGVPYHINYPQEHQKAVLPEYRVEPPDILLINALNIVPRPPYTIAPLDVLTIQATGTYPEEPIRGPYPVEPDGTINLGTRYGRVPVAGLTLEQARVEIETFLAQIVRMPQVSVSLAQSRAMQQITGEHLVRPDGTVSLGTYGPVFVAGLTLTEARQRIEQHLSQFILDPEISLDVFAYNSKAYYIITDGGGSGQQIVRMPITGNETVLDAIANIGGLSAVSDKKIWVARPDPNCQRCGVNLPVDWVGLTEYGIAATNYQLMPGDRVYIQSDPLICFDTVVAKVTAPFQRILGGVSFTYIVLRQANAGVTGNQGAFGGGGVGF